MRYSSKLAFPEADNERATPRDDVWMPVRVRELGSVAFDARITDISPAGCRLKGCDLPQRAEVWLTLGPLPPLRARVVWCARNECGCHFYRPLGRRELLAITDWAPGSGSAAE